MTREQAHTGAPPPGVDAERPWDGEVPRVGVVPVVVFWAVVVVGAATVGGLTGSRSAGWVVVLSGAVVSLGVGGVRMLVARPFERTWWERSRRPESKQLRRVCNRPSRFAELPDHLRARAAADLARQMRLLGAWLPWALPGFTVIGLNNVLLLLQDGAGWSNGVSLVSSVGLLGLLGWQLVVLRSSRAVLTTAAADVSTARSAEPDGFAPTSGPEGDGRSRSVP